MPHNFLELIGSFVAAAPSDPHAIYLNQLPIHMQIAEETVKYGGSSRGSLDAPPQNGGMHNFCKSPTCGRKVPPRRLSQSAPENCGAFSSRCTVSIAGYSTASKNRCLVTARRLSFRENARQHSDRPCEAQFTWHIKGMRHAERPKQKHEHAPI